MAIRSKARRNFHVPLSEELYDELREEAQRSDQPATELAREAIDHWLARRKKQALHEAVASYASKWARTDVDLDPEFEAASSELLADEE